MLVETLSWCAVWLACLFVIGIVAFPLAYRLMPTLASRGVGLSPALGLLLVSYIAWILASLHLVPFGRTSLAISVLAVAIIATLVEFRTRGEALRWLRDNLGLVLTYGVALVAVFAVFCWLRGYYPDVRNTEKPMEISFLTSTMRAQWMPPSDAWLSGYNINYYYFGYVEAAAIGLLGGLRPEVTFNLMSITLPALTFVGASGIVYDLLARWRVERGRSRRGPRTVFASFTGGALVAIAGNAYGFARLLTAPDTVLDPSTTFWTGIGWNSSRVVHDHIIPGQVAELITEFPMFSFILGDIHPHVLALPTVLLAVGVALGLWMKPSSGGPAMIGRYLLAALVIGALYPTNAWDLPTFALPVLGAIALRRWHGRLNRTPNSFAVAYESPGGVPIDGVYESDVTSDRLPARSSGWLLTSKRIFLVLRDAGAVLLAAIILFLPYYLNFKSIIGNHEGGEPAAIHDLTSVPLLGTIIRTFGIVVWPHTDLGQFLAVFGLPLAAAGALVIRGNIARRAPFTESQRRAFLGAAVGIGFVALLTRTPMLLPTGAVVLGGVIALLRPATRRPHDASPWAVWSQMDRAVTAIAVYGALLPIITEFVFLRDAFDNRMNTMFKVDYQAWILLMLAGAYGIVTLLWTAREAVRSRQQAAGREQSTEGSEDYGIGARVLSGHDEPPYRRRSFLNPLLFVRVGIIIFTLFAATYPIVVPIQRTGYFGRQAVDFSGPGEPWQGMDGFAYVRITNPDEYHAAIWLRDHVQSGDRLVEALGNSYGDANGWFESRFAAATGTPGVLGWYFHEYQWREGSPAIVDRELPQRARDIGTLYNTTNAAEARQILAKYGITWVIVGSDEQDGEGRCGLNAGCPPYAAPGLAKFSDMLDLAYHQGRVSIYHVP